MGNAEDAVGGTGDTAEETTESSTGFAAPIEGDEPGGEVGATLEPPENGSDAADLRSAEWAAVESELHELRTLVDERLRRDETKEGAFRRLYEDLEFFKQSATAYQFRPLYLDIILLMDRLEVLMGSHQAADPCHAALASVHDELSEILARRGVSVSTTASDSFDPKLQRAVDVIPTDDGQQHHTVAQVLRPGYESEGAVLRPADVVVRRYAPPDTVDGPAEPAAEAEPTS